MDKSNMDGMSYDSRLIDPSQKGMLHGLGTIGEEDIDDTRNWNKTDALNLNSNDI
jgi:hypothetical protein